MFLPLSGHSQGKPVQETKWPVSTETLGHLISSSPHLKVLFFASLFLFLFLLLLLSSSCRPPTRLLVTMVNASWCIDASITCQLCLLLYSKFTLQLSRDRLLHSSRAAFSLPLPLPDTQMKWSGKLPILSPFLTFYPRWIWTDREMASINSPGAPYHTGKAPAWDWQAGKREFWWTQTQANKSWGIFTVSTVSLFQHPPLLVIIPLSAIFAELFAPWPFDHSSTGDEFVLPLSLSPFFRAHCRCKNCVWVRVTRRRRKKRKKERGERRNECEITKSRRAEDAVFHC